MQILRAFKAPKRPLEEGRQQCIEPMELKTDHLIWSIQMHEMIKQCLYVHTTSKPLKEPQLITQMWLQVSKDERSDIETSSDEETDTTSKERLKTGSRTHSPRGENGTNGHFGPKSWSQNHSDWWRSLHVAFAHKELVSRKYPNGTVSHPCTSLQH